MAAHASPCRPPLGIWVAAASSSNNAGTFLRMISLEGFTREHGIDSPSLRPGRSLLDFFDADVSGRDFAQGKPPSGNVPRRRRRAGREPEHTFVIEDASAGVEAAKAGAMPAIGVARFDDEDLLEDLLEAAGADIVVTTLDRVDLAELQGGGLVTV